MIAKVPDKRAELALQWNTRLEVIGRLTIIGFSFLGLFMAYFTGAGCAMAHDDFLHRVGMMSHATYQLHYIIAGISAAVVSVIFFGLIAIPYFRLRRASRFKMWLITSFIFTIIYYLILITLAVSFMLSYHVRTTYLWVGIFGSLICFLFVSAGLWTLWQEVKRQWRIRKSFEYLNDEKLMQQSDKVIAQLETERQVLAEENNKKYHKVRWQYEKKFIEEHFNSQDTLTTNNDEQKKLDKNKVEDKKED